MPAITELDRRTEIGEGQPDFIRKLEALWAQRRFVCVGLDSDYAQIPEPFKAHMSTTGLETENDLIAHTISTFNRLIVDATHKYVCAYKPNISFYEAYGEAGLRALESTIRYIHEVHPEIPVILDAKRADIGNTNNGYATAVFDKFGADAVTVNPYFGGGSLKPFTDREDKGIIVLARTSNQEAGELQDLPVDLGKLPQGDGKTKGYEEKFGEMEGLKQLAGSDVVPLYMIVAYNASRKWNAKGNVCIVAGATYPGELKKIREIVGNMPILVPGIGAQGGEVEATVRAGKDSRSWGMIVNASRGIIFASKGEDFAEAAGREAQKLNTEIRKVLREARVNEILEQTGAVIVDGHFLLASGKHSERYINKDWIYPNTRETEELCRMWAEEFKDAGVEVVVAPEKGGIILSHETARLLTQITGKKVDGVYAEKSHDSQLNDFTFARGYDQFVKGRRALVVEDILTTGGSAKSVANLVRETGGEVVGIGAIVNRGKVKPEDVGVERLFALTNIEMESWVPSECPRCEKGIPINNKIGRGKELVGQVQSQTS